MKIYIACLVVSLSDSHMVVENMKRLMRLQPTCDGSWGWADNRMRSISAAREMKKVEIKPSHVSNCSG